MPAQTHELQRGGARTKSNASDLTTDNSNLTWRGHRRNQWKPREGMATKAQEAQTPMSYFLRILCLFVAN